METFLRVATDIAEFAKRLFRAIPEPGWFRYAALRLGTFTMSYVASMAIIILGFAIAGVVLSIGAVLIIMPFCVLIAIRISGSMTKGKDVDTKTNRKKSKGA